MALVACAAMAAFGYVVEEDKMKAFIISEDSNMSFTDNFTVPSIGSLREIFTNVTSCEVLIQVKASSVNPADRYNDDKRLPKVIGSDLAGVVIDAEQNCTRIKKGDKVWGDIGANALLLSTGEKTKELGAYGEYAVALESQLGIMPENIDFVEAGTLPKVSLTSYKALVWYAGAPWNNDKNILILGGSGGTGSVGIQLAKAFGAKSVTVTTSLDNFDYCKSLGADQLIDYKSQDWWTILQDNTMDIIYDTVGQPGTADYAMRVLKSNGYFVTIAGALTQHPLKNITQSFFINSDTNIINYNQLDSLKELVESNKLRMTKISGNYSLENVAEGFNQSESGHTVGKISIVIDNSTYTGFVYE